jgi:hypothetical protein
MTEPKRFSLLSLLELAVFLGILVILLLSAQ